DPGEHQEHPAPVHDPRQLAAQQGADDRGEAAQPGQAGVEGDQGAALVDVTAGGLSDHDAGGAGQSLREAGEDQRDHTGTERAQHGGGDVGEDADDQRPAPAEASWPLASPIRQAVTVSCAAEAGASRSRASSGSTGRYRSIDSGPNTVSSISIAAIAGPTGDCG